MTTDAAIRWVRTPLSDERRSLSRGLLTPAEREREPTDAFLAGRLLLRELAAELGHGGEVSATCPDCGREHGRPRIERLFVSIAHADGLTVVAASVDGPIGIDVERDDARVPAAVAGGEGVRHWTAVEAVLKADGRGLRVDPREVTVSAGFASVERVTYAISHPQTAPGFTTAVARAVPFG